MSTLTAELRALPFLSWMGASRGLWRNFSQSQSDPANPVPVQGVDKPAGGRCTGETSRKQDGMGGGEKEGSGGREFQEQPGFNQFRRPDRKPEVFNYNSSPEKIFYLPTPCLRRWEVSRRWG